MSAVCDSALVQLAITGRTSPVRRRPSTDDDDDGHLIYTGHLAVPDHLQVVGVLQENLPQSENVELERFSHPDNEKIVLGISGDGLLKQLFCI